MSLVHKKPQDTKQKSFKNSDVKNIILRDLFCELCKLQFNKKVVYDMHQLVVHGKTHKIKEEPFDSGDENVSEKGRQGVTEYLIDSGKNISETGHVEETDRKGYIATVHEKRTSICGYQSSHCISSWQETIQVFHL